MPWSIASQAFLQACCEIGGKRRYLLSEGVGVIGKTSFMTSWIFLILLACPPCCEVGQGRVVEVEDFGIAFAVGDAALHGNPKPPLKPAEVVTEDEGTSEGGKPQASIHQGIDLSIIVLRICLSRRVKLRVTVSWISRARDSLRIISQRLQSRLAKLTLVECVRRSKSCSFFTQFVS